MKNYFLLLLLPMLFTSCEPLKSIVKDFRVKKFVTSNSDVVLVSSVEIDLLDALGVDLELPAGTKKELKLGKLGYVGTAYIDKGNRLSLALNLSRFINNIEYSETGVLLPNGNKLPVIGDDEVFAIPLTIGKVNPAELILYLSFVKGKVVLGMTLTFDLEIKQRFQVILPFEIKGVPLQAGVFVGDQPGDTGIATFFDLTDVIGYRVVNTQGEEVRFQLIEKEEAKVYYQEPSRKDLRKANKELKRLKKSGGQKVIIH